MNIILCVHSKKEGPQDEGTCPRPLRVAESALELLLFLPIFHGMYSNSKFPAPGAKGR